MKDTFQDHMALPGVCTIQLFVLHKLGDSTDVSTNLPRGPASETVGGEEGAGEAVGMPLSQLTNICQGEPLKSLFSVSLRLPSLCPHSPLKAA